MVPFEVVVVAFFLGLAVGGGAGLLFGMRD